jgi:hypothetical protein
LFKKRGGKRRGAGRPPKGARAGSPHKERPYLHARYPVHVVLRAVGAVGNLRRRRVYHAIRQATLTTARREDFQIVHLSIQRTHVHLLVEAQDKAALIGDHLGTISDDKQAAPEAAGLAVAFGVRALRVGEQERQPVAEGGGDADAGEQCRHELVQDVTGAHGDAARRDRLATDALGGVC